MELCWSERSDVYWEVAGLERHFQANAKCDLSPQKEQIWILCSAGCMHFFSASPRMFQLRQMDWEDFGMTRFPLRELAYTGRLSSNVVNLH